MASINLGSYVSSLKGNDASVLGYNADKGTFSLFGGTHKIKNNTGDFGTVASISLDKNGTIVVDATKALTTVSAVNEITYNGTSAVSILGGTQFTKVTTGSGADYVSVASLAGGNFGAGNDSLYAAKASGSINMGDGADFVSVGITQSGFNLNLGDGINIATVADMKNGTSTITGGAGTDSVMAKYVGDKVVFNLGNGANYASITYDAATAENISVTTGTGNDYVTVAGTSKISSGSINLGDGINTLHAASISGVAVTTGTGADSISLTASSNVTVQAGAGADAVSLSGVTASRIDLGAGADNVTLAGDMAGDSLVGGAGVDKYHFSGNANEGTAVITDFEYGTDVIVHSGIKASVLGGTVLGTDGTVSLASGTGVKIASSTGYYYGTFADNDSDTTINVAWAADGQAMLNGIDQNKPLVIVGTVNEEQDTLVGGKKADTIIAGKNDYVYGGAGNDTINLNAGSDTREFVGLAKGMGKDSVEGFVTGFGDEADAVYFFDSNVSDVRAVSTTGSNVVIKMSEGSLQLNNSSSTDVALNVEDKSGNLYTASIVGGTVSTSDVEDIANFVYAASDSKKTAALDFSAVGDNLVVDLGNTGISALEDNSTYVGTFSTLTGGTDVTKLAGGKGTKETIIATGGLTSMWGGGSASDYMQGNSNSQSTFFYGTGDGRDTVTSTNWGSSDEADTLYFLSTDLSGVSKDSSKISVKLNGTSDKLTVLGVSDINTNVKFTVDGVNTAMAKVGQTGVANAFTYDADTTFYLGSTKVDTLTVDNTVDSANIWLGGETGKGYGGIDIVDASGNTGTVQIAGTANAETLYAGSGENSLWGGAGNDVMTGNSSGSTTFYFGTGNGNDTITASSANDRVMAYNVTAENLASVTTDASGNMTATLTDGSSLTITSGNAVSTFTLGDGSTWVHDSATGAWSQQG